MSSSGFSTMSWLKLVNTTRASFLSMPSTERTNREKNMLLVSVLTMIILLLLLPTSQEFIRRFVLVCVHVSISKYDIDDGASLDLAKSFDENVTSCLKSGPPLTYLLLWSDADPVEEGLAVYAFRGEGLLIEVDEIVTYFFVTWNDEASVSSDNSMTYGEG